MYKGKNILCVIPARGGSKGLQGKNIKKLLGKPLIIYTIEQAKNSEYIDRIIVSTDDNKIAAIAKSAGAEVPFMRPQKLATDRSSTIDVLLHAVDWMIEKEKYIFDVLALLHANTPLRSATDIDKSIEFLFSSGAGNVFSVTPATRNPYFNMVEIGKNGKIRLVKKGDFATRQSAPKVFDMNSSIYVWKKDVFKKNKSVFSNNTKVYVMPKERSIDIDDQLDFDVAEMLMRRYKKL